MYSAGTQIAQALRARADVLDQEASAIHSLMITEPIADESDRHIQVRVKSMTAEEFRQLADLILPV